MTTQTKTTTLDTMLSDRIKIILSETGIKQADFAKSLGISANYVYLLTSGKKTVISETLAKLIECVYGYSAEWIMEGIEPVGRTVPQGFELHAEVIHRIIRLSKRELRVVSAFLDAL